MGVGVWVCGCACVCGCVWVCVCVCVCVLGSYPLVTSCAVLISVYLYVQYKAILGTVRCLHACKMCISMMLGQTSCWCMRCAVSCLATWQPVVAGVCARFECCVLMHVSLSLSLSPSPSPSPSPSLSPSLPLPLPLSLSLSLV